jgi:transcriptional regulator GlxA family with amidase domain
LKKLLHRDAPLRCALQSVRRSTDARKRGRQSHNAPRVPRVRRSVRLLRKKLVRPARLPRLATQANCKQMERCDGNDSGRLSR